MSATRCVPQTTHMKGIKYSCGNGQYYWKQQKGVPLCFYGATCKLLTIFTHILN